MSEQRMNPEIKARWVAALRSGEYAQARHFLRTRDGFCCLGVLCDLHQKAGQGEWVQGSYDRLTMGMPEVVGNWAGIEWGSGPLVRIGHDELPVAVHNDNGETFEQIAAAIEEQL